jgi:transcriptional regulator with XRE-family HTH domain
MQATTIGDAPSNGDHDGLRLRVEALDTLMAAKGIDTKVAQAEAFGLARTYWFNIRSGRRFPTLATAMRIAQVAGTTVEFLFERES